MHKFLNEQIILYRIRKGDTESFGHIFDFYHEKIYRFVYLKVATGEDAEDIVAETFLKVWQYIKEGKKIKTLQAFLYQIARNLVVDFYRRKGAPTESLEDAEITIADRSDLSLEEKMTLKSDMAKVEGALRLLKDAYREVIVLHFLNELSLSETAKIIEKSPGATRVLLHRGMKTLKNMLNEDGGSRNEGRV
ncbi:RNA polymerase sigma factor [Candidatus Uhrbacteria bacterium]|nr:RNA polymerase sigma factor [Candidatus Uhrbacteria bacterium]